MSTIIIITDEKITNKILEDISEYCGNIIKTNKNKVKKTNSTGSSKRDEIVKLLKQGIDPEIISETLNVSLGTVRAYKAHITMGHF